MCIASKYLKKIDNLIAEIKHDQAVLTKKQSEIDKQISVHYHKIEIHNFNAAEGYYLAKQLQEMLQKRRIIKDELYRVRMLLHDLQSNEVSNKINHSKKVVHKAIQSSCKWNKGFSVSFKDIDIQLSH